MNRILIVDDEHHIVNWIAALLDSITNPELEVMKAYSGSEAIDIMKRYKMDILLLDIHMPGMTGLQVAQAALSEWPTTRIIFLTAYDNFDYLYQATKLPGTSYLLKSENDTAIIEQIRKTVQEILAEREANNILAQAGTQKLMLEHIMQQESLRRLVYGFSSVESSNTSYEFPTSAFSLNFEKPVYILYTRFTGVVFRIRAKHYTEGMVAAALTHTANITACKFAFSMLELDAESMLWFFQDTRPQPAQTEIPALDILKNISDDLMSLLERLSHRCTINLLVDEAVSEKDLHHLLYQIQQYSDYHFLSCSQTLSFCTIISRKYLSVPACNSSVSMKQLPSPHTEELSFYLQQKDRNAYMALLTEISTQYTSRNSMHDITVIQVYFSISMILMQYICQYHLKEKLALVTAIYPLYYLNDFHSWKEAFSYLLTVSEKIFSLITTVESNSNEHIVSSIERYITEHISESLSLSEIAGTINYNAAYISRLYKKARGISLFEYITQSRIRLAANLLTTTNDSIQSIATKTGYDTAQYFSIAFKKETGLSPRDYRNLKGK